MSIGVRLGFARWGSVGGPLGVRRRLVEGSLGVLWGPLGSVGVHLRSVGGPLGIVLEDFETAKAKDRTVTLTRPYR